MSVIGQLSRLESAGLVSLKAAHPEVEYLFRHALVHEAVYHSLLKHDRKQLHLATGETLERSVLPDAGRLDEFAPLLAQHFYEGGDDYRALVYFLRAAMAAVRVYANAEAVAYYDRALEIAPRVAAGAVPWQEVYSSRGRALELIGQYERAVGNYEAMEDEARAQGDRELELAALTARATLYATPTSVLDPEKGKALSHRALALARERGNRPAEAKVLWVLMLAHYFSAKADEAAPFGEQSLAIARELNLREQMAFTLNDLTHTYVAIGAHERARAAEEESRRLWRDQGNLTMLTDNLASGADHAYTAGELDTSLRLSEEAYGLARTIGSAWGQCYSRWIAGYVHWERGDSGQAIACLEDAVALARLSGLVIVQSLPRIDLGLIYAELGALERGLGLAQEGLAFLQPSTPPVIQGWAWAALARLHVLRQDLPAASRAIEQRRRLPQIDDFSTPAPIMIALAEGEFHLAQNDAEQAVAVATEIQAKMERYRIRAFMPPVLYLAGRALIALHRDDEARA
ncbi:MAG: hypothetical protein HYR71_00615, partial [Chloroflexi bacterium]|nr:hypothetical protein [Chloroflexota bacterium]